MKIESRASSTGWVAVHCGMASRAADWWKQAQRDLDHARSARRAGFHEWACFASQQGAEKAVKAVIQEHGGSARGHAVRSLLEALSERLGPGNELLSDARELDRHYIPSRYPNSVPEGAPYESYDADQSERAIAAAARILAWCERHMAGP